MTNTALAVQSSSSGSGAPMSARLRAQVAIIEQFAREFRMSKKMGPASFEEFERGLHERVMEIERDVLVEEMTAADVTSPAIRVNGVVYHRVLEESSQSYLTAAGEVRVARGLYKDRTDEGARAIVPMELKWGIVEGLMTPLAAKQSAWVVAHMVPQQGEELLARMGNMKPSKSTLDRLPKALSERWEEQRKAFEQALRVEELVPEDAVSVAVSLDGVLLPMENGHSIEKRAATAAAGQLTRGPAGYREAGCATLCFCNDQGKMIKAIRLGRMPQAKKAALKDSLTEEVLEVLRKAPNLTVVKLADGANDNWTYLAGELTERGVPGEECIDFFHAAEHLASALGAAYGEGTVEARAEDAKLRTILEQDHEGVDKVIAALAKLRRRKPKSKKLATELGYFRKNKHRMRYAHLWEQGLPIGSGLVEAACKTLVAQRMKLSGMRWGLPGGQAILTLRALTQSDRFDRAWALLAATYAAEVEILHNVVPLGAGRSAKRKKRP